MAKLLLKHEGVTVNTVAIDKDVVTIGRKLGNDIQLNDAVVSSEHACLLRRPSEYLEGHFTIFLKDLASTNGTMVNGQLVNEILLRHGDRIQVGNQHFVFDSEQDEEDMEATAIFIPEND